ncbi:MAG: kynurenine formamidase [Haloarculaceae archaeon]|jgi:kynurenine formamidase
MPTYDCSHAIQPGMSVYPGDDPVRVEETATIQADGARVHDLGMTTHTGTHIDAPAHAVADGPTLDDFDVEAFRFEARVVDCTPCRDRERLTLAVLPEEVRANPVEELDMLVFRTNWSEYWGTERYRDSPYLGGDLARWCAEAGFHVGLDTFSPDPVPSADPSRESAAEPTDLPAHGALCGADRFVVENLRGLARLPERVELATLPLAIADADGSPVRAVAHTREQSHI